MKGITYLVRQDDTYSFTVTKWDGGIVPIREYRVKLGEDMKLRCNCPSGTYRGYCKHKDIVMHWLKEGRVEGREFDEP